MTTIPQVPAPAGAESVAEWRTSSDGDQYRWFNGTRRQLEHCGGPVELTIRAVDLVILSDSLVADPRMVRDLHSRGVPHLPVRVRDGIGLVGPLVIPGVTSCLGCADLHRSDRDAAWPAIAAQLRDTVGVADRATLLATAALALSQVNRVIAAVRGQEAVPDPGPPPALNATLEFDLNAGSIVARPWTRHPLCSC